MVFEDEPVTRGANVAGGGRRVRVCYVCTGVHNFVKGDRYEFEMPEGGEPARGEAFHRFGEMPNVTTFCTSFVWNGRSASHGINNDLVVFLAPKAR